MNARPFNLARRTFWLLVAVGICPLFAGGCVAAKPVRVAPDETFESLHRRDLSAFERQLAMERREGEHDAWTRVGEAWLDLINCTGVDHEQREPDALDEMDDAPTARLMLATLTLETRRRNTRALDEEIELSPTLFSKLTEDDFFEREPDDLPDNLVRWPAEREAWKDEGLAEVAVESQCAELRDKLLVVEGDEGDEGDTEYLEAEARRFYWLRAQLDAVEELVAIEQTLPAGAAQANLALLLWRVRVHGAHVVLKLADGTPGAHRKFRARGLTFIEELPSDISGASPQESARMQFLRARLAFDTGNKELALADLRAALERGLQSPNAERAQYLAVRILTDAGRWKEALAVVDKLPDETSPLFEPLAYRLALAARQLGDDKRFFRIAIGVLADKPATGSAFRRAVHAQALELLASYEFDRRVVELVEDLGPRNELFKRVAELSGVALRRGYPASAASAAEWLLRHHHNYRYSPTYHRLLALAAFMQDDEETFREHVHAMTRRDPRVAAAVGQKREASFFANADRAFARLMGQMLPAMAEWGDGRAAKQRRQRWLALAVEETQAFLRTVERSQVRPELLELYEVASKLLEEHPRGYAARLGDRESTPLVLGTVEVGQAELLAGEPRVTPMLDAPYFLSLVPRPGQPPAQWSFGWGEIADE